MQRYRSITKLVKFQAELQKTEGYSKLTGRTAGIVMHTNISVFTSLPELSIIPVGTNAAAK